MMNSANILKVVGLSIGLAMSGTATAGCKDHPKPGVNWNNCNVQMLMLEKTDLSGANLEGAFLSGSVFTDSKLAKANMHLAELVRSSFEGADLTEASFEKALAARAIFMRAKLNAARLVKAEFLRVTLKVLISAVRYWRKAISCATISPMQIFPEPI
jgi:uncharacterized protein YjbI with pentapeptide repeats